MDSRKLDDLDPAFRPLVVEFLARLAEAKIPVLVTATRRSQADHEANVAAGRSWTHHSKHIDGLAIDICPYHSFNPTTLLWDVPDSLAAALWDRVGEIGESCGLKWGGRFKQRDMVHFEYSGAADGQKDVPHLT